MTDIYSKKDCSVDISFTDNVTVSWVFLHVNAILSQNVKNSMQHSEYTKVRKLSCNFAEILKHLMLLVSF
jgi:hypothetical protein